MTASHYELNYEIIDDLLSLLGVGYFELMEEQITQANEYLAEIESLMLAGTDPATVSKRAHAFKSSTGQVGLLGIYALAKKLEYQTKIDAGAGAAISGDAKQFYAELTEHYLPAVRILRDYAIEKRGAN